MTTATKSTTRADDPPHARDRAAIRAKSLVRWFRAARRKLPWRAAPAGQRDPYATLVSEIMLQQTQASRVADRLPRFLARFPTIEDLARATEHDVLAEWSGLGYYRRARLLHAAAKATLEQHDASLPSDPAALRALPGLGEYTAAAVASLAFDAPTPAIDANVARILARLHAIAEPTNSSRAKRELDHHAQQLLDASPANPGEHNEALIELGALVCTPRNPKCDACPLAADCQARAQSRQHELPVKQTKAPRKPLHCLALVATNTQQQRLITQRPKKGLWASMWQAPTIESHDDPPRPSDLASLLELTKAQESQITPLDEHAFTHATTHREVHFHIAALKLNTKTTPEAARWIHPSDLDTIPLSTPQRRILTLDV